jgi:hypothetical protein
MEKKEIDYCAAPQCPAGKHQAEPAQAPWYSQCSVCGTRFALISEQTLNAMDIFEENLIERPMVKQ